MRRLVKFFQQCTQIIGRWLFWVQLVRLDGTNPIWVSKSDFYRPFRSLLRAEEFTFFTPLFDACGSEDDLRVGDVVQYSSSLLERYGVPPGVIKATEQKLETIGLSLGMMTRW